MTTRSKKPFKPDENAPSATNSRSRPPRNPTKHEFEIKKILSGTNIKNKDILGHMLYLKKENKPKAPTKDIISLLISDLHATFPDALHARTLDVKIEKVWLKYDVFKKNKTRNVDKRRTWLQKDFVIFATENRPVIRRAPNRPISVNHDFVDTTLPDDTRAHRTRRRTSNNCMIIDGYDADDDEEDEEQPTERENRRNMRSLPVLSEVVLRYGTPYNESAAIASATLVDCGIVTEDDTSEVIDGQKVARQAKKLIKQAKDLESQEDVNNMYFDSKKITGKVMLNSPPLQSTTSQDEDITVTPNATSERQNLYVFVHGPKGKFLFSEITVGETAHAAVEMIKQSFHKRELDLSKIYLIGVDGTNTNTGHRNGIIRQLEVIFFDKTLVLRFIHTQDH